MRGASHSLALGGFHWRLAVVQLLFLVFSVFWGGLAVLSFFLREFKVVFRKFDSASNMILGMLV